MKNFVLSAGLALAVFTSAPVHAHDPESRVSIESDMVGPVQAGTTHYVFELVDTKLNTVLKDSDLLITHEKILHMVAYDPALKEFQHVHPEFDGRYWKVDLDFSVDGNYFVWVQGQLKSDSSEFSSFVRLQVNGGQAEWPTPPILTETRRGVNSGSVATLSNGALHAGQAAMLTLTFSRADGSAAQITPYLGAFAHVIATPDDGDSLTHVHPMDGGTPSTGMLHITFPDAGSYRIWVQFIDAGVLKLIPLAVTVAN